MSHRLKQRGLSHLVLERHRIAERWRSERWDGLRFQFPNWSVQLPDFPFPHSDPDAFASSGDIVAFIEAYADFVAPPIRCGVAVTRLRSRRRVRVCRGDIRTARSPPKMSWSPPAPISVRCMPDLLRDQAGIFQVHASRYQNPEQLPPGAVLVVGAGASGAQIAEELHRAGRRVFLSVGQHTRMPRRYRGHDLTWWFGALGLFRHDAGATRADPGQSRRYRAPMAATPSTFAASPPTASRCWEGFRRRATACSISRPGLAESLANGDAYYAMFLDLLDAHVERTRPPSARRPRRACGARRPALRHRTDAQPRPRARRISAR